jgi:hypothetical protein
MVSTELIHIGKLHLGAYVHLGLVGAYGVGTRWEERARLEQHGVGTATAAVRQELLGAHCAGEGGQNDYGDLL